MSKTLVLAIWLSAFLFLTACATPKIDSANVGRPKTVVIQDFPDMYPAATIQVIVTNWPQFYFSNPIDQFYVVGGITPAQRLRDNNMVSGVVNGAVTGALVAKNSNGNVRQGAVGGAVVGLVVGSIINASAEATEKKAAEFPSLFKQAMPGVDMRGDILKAIKAALEAKGIQVTIASETRDAVPRLYWPANAPRGEDMVTGSLAEHPAVNADVLVQLSPLAIYAAPGPLNSYDSKVGIGVAMYNGRTREFIGWQALSSTENKLSYTLYDSLVKNIAQVAPAQYQSLMSLVPQLANVISGEQK